VPAGRFRPVPSADATVHVTRGRRHTSGAEGLSHVGAGEARHAPVAGIVASASWSRVPSAASPALPRKALRTIVTIVIIVTIAHRASRIRGISPGRA
jgi:hypothetical protein